MLGQEPELELAPRLMAFKVIHEEVLKQIEAMSVVTHVATGIVRESPLYKTTGKAGDRHYLQRISMISLLQSLNCHLVFLKDRLWLLPLHCSRSWRSPIRARKGRIFSQEKR